MLGGKIQSKCIWKKGISKSQSMSSCSGMMLPWAFPCSPSTWADVTPPSHTRVPWPAVGSIMSQLECSWEEWRLALQWSPPQVSISGYGRHHADSQGHPKEKNRDLSCMPMLISWAERSYRCITNGGIWLQSYLHLCYMEQSLALSCLKSMMTSVNLRQR